MGRKYKFEKKNQGRDCEIAGCGNKGEILFRDMWVCAKCMNGDDSELRLEDFIRSGISTFDGFF